MVRLSECWGIVDWGLEESIGRMFALRSPKGRHEDAGEFVGFALERRCRGGVLEPRLDDEAKPELALVGSSATVASFETKSGLV